MKSTRKPLLLACHSVMGTIRPTQASGGCGAHLVAADVLEQHSTWQHMHMSSRQILKGVGQMDALLVVRLPGT